jgi:hypothetical protein
MITPAEPVPTQVRDFEELLRRAAAYSRLVRFRSYVSRGVIKMGFNEIGETAGAVWETLLNEGPLNLATLMDEVNAPESIFLWPLAGSRVKPS